MAANGCTWIDLNCRASEFLASSIGDALTKTADAVLEAVGKAIAAVGTMWVNVGTPALTGGGGSSGVNPGDHAAADGIDTVLGWATYVAFGICVLSLTWLGVRMGTGRSEGHEHASRLGIVLVSTVMVSAAAGLVSAIAPAVRSTGSAPVAFVQDSLWFYMIAVTILSVILGGCRMAWEQRADAGRDLVRSLLTLTVVSAVGITAVSLLTAAGDGFSVWLLNGSLGCDIADPNGTCFGGNMTALLALTSNPATGALGPVLVILLGVMALLGSLIQVLLMIVRAGMLVLLCGVLPLSAAATNTETGRNMFRKATGWLLAFILYKPAAAIVYATAFKLTGTSVFKDDGSGLISITTGLTLMAVAILALPALMSLIVPAVSSIASGGGMAAAAVAGAAAMLPTGAISGGRLFGGGGNSDGDSSSDGGSSSTTSAPSGATPGAPGGAGEPGPSPDPSAESSTGASGGASAGAGAAGGAGASGGAAAGAAAGPVGAAAGVALSAVSAAGKVASAASGAAASTAESGSEQGDSDGHR